MKSADDRAQSRAIGQPRLGAKLPRCVRGLLSCLLLGSALLADDIDVCRDQSMEQAWSTSPVHSDGLRLQRRLQSSGIQVHCMRRSKEEHLFEGQKGAAWIKTDHGIVEAWFLPANESFASLTVKESLLNGRYFYSFGGLPHGPQPLESSQPIAFIKDGSTLLQVWGNPGLAKQLRQSFGRSR